MLKEILKRNKGITLIALVVTIIVLLILAGISIMMLAGQNGILNRAKNATEEQTHGAMNETIGLRFTEYMTEQRIDGLTDDFITYMKNKGYVDDNGIIKISDLLGGRQALGNGTGKKDVYILEKSDNTYVVNYYDKNENKNREVWRASDTTSSSNGVTKRDENMFEFDATTGTIIRIKEEYLVDYYNDEWASYLDRAGKWCKIEDGIDTLVIPSSINGVNVKKIESLGVVNVKKIVIESGIEEIESIGHSMWNTSSKLYKEMELKEIDIPNSVTKIGESALKNCIKLTNVKIPESVTYIGGSAFAECSNLTSIVIPKNVTYIGGRAFENCTKLTNIIIPESVTYIGESAFENCENIKSIKIPKNVTQIDTYAFSGCKGITEFSVEDGNTVYDSRGNCNALINTNENKLIFGFKSTIIPSTVTAIGSSAFYEREGLTNIIIPSNVTEIGSNAFYGCKGLTNITIPSSVTEIGSYAFRSCTGLNSVTILNGISEIGSGIFDDCTGLASINIPDSVTTIGEGAFSRCTGLTNIIIPKSVTKIGSRAFYGCTEITEIYIPDTTKNIDGNVFENWTENQIINFQGEKSNYSLNYWWDFYCKAQINWNVSK